MLGLIVRGGVRMFAGTVLGVVPGTLYAILVGLVNFAVYGPWDEVPDFPVGGVLGGMLFGLLAGIAWALSGATATDSSPQQRVVDTRAEAARTSPVRPRFLSVCLFCRTRQQAPPHQSADGKRASGAA
jgi:hypothetical protein